MTAAGAQIAGANGAGNAAQVRDWQAMRADGDIQYAPLPPIKPPDPPDWLKTLGEWLRAGLEAMWRSATNPFREMNPFLTK